VSGRYGWRTFAIEVALIAFAAVFLFPLYVLVVQALKDPAELAASPLGLPTRLYLGNFVQAWTSARIGPALLSSTIVTGTSILLLVVLGSLGAYVQARQRPKVASLVLLFFVLGIILPFQLALIPLYQLIKNLGLLGSYAAMILFHTGGLLPLAVFLFTGFLRNSTRSYEEAALIDGASKNTVFWKIILPSSRPIVVYTAITAFIAPWVDFIFVSVIMKDDYANYTVALGLFRMLEREHIYQYFTRFCAGAVLVAIPITLLFIRIQKFYVEGVTGGAVKG